MTYNELLNQKEWWSKCNEILSRDHFVCKDCGSLGYHNGGSYMKLCSLFEVDRLLKGWLFSGMPFSKFWDNVPESTPHPIKNIPFQIESSDGELTVYNLNLFQTKSSLFKNMWSIPEKVIAVSKQKIESLDATVYHFIRIAKYNDSLETYGQIHLFEFPCVISDELYVNIEYSLPYIIDGVRYDRDVINITFGNRLFSFRFPPYSIPAKINGLNIHHTYYVRGHKPWEYDNEALVTLCENCHKKRHETSSIPYYDKERLVGNLVPCDRCGGSGYLPQYNHVENGICFKCGGEGVVLSETF
jgi:hypothetical protein